MRATTLALFTITSLLLVGGCAKVMTMDPESGPPGMPVYVDTCGMFGDPTGQTLLWDGEVIRDPFCGSFTVPRPEDGGTPGPHDVTVVDNLDVDEAMLIFPMFRVRHHTVTFNVTGP
ncbi:MAG: hypothetical protein JW936_03280 [Sedimentisphaerales bacterium]|nr:hypothetical protein [Sedimentisphaerales bacterium]